MKEEHICTLLPADYKQKNIETLVTALYILVAIVFDFAWRNMLSVSSFSFMCQLGMDDDGHDPIIASSREGDTHLIQWKSTLRKIPNPPWSHCQGDEINATHHHHRVVDGVSWCSPALPASWETTWRSGAVFGQGWKPRTLLNFDHGRDIVVGGVWCSAEISCLAYNNACSMG